MEPANQWPYKNNIMSKWFTEEQKATYVAIARYKWIYHVYARSFQYFQVKRKLTAPLEGHSSRESLVDNDTAKLNKMSFKCNVTVCIFPRVYHRRLHIDVYLYLYHIRILVLE